MWGLKNDRTLSIIMNRDHRRFMVEMPFLINTSSGFFSEDSYSFSCYQSDGEFIPDPRRSDREITFAQV